MKAFFRLGSEAGMIRSNTFETEEDAVLMGTYRAYARGVPIRVYYHEDQLVTPDGVLLVVCNVDGSVGKPEAVGREPVDLGNQPGFRNRDQANVVFASYGDQPLTTYYLKDEASESVIAGIERATGVEMGLYDPETLHCYTGDTAKLKQIEDHLAKAGVEIDHYAASATLASVGGVGEIVTAARKAHTAARESRLPEFSVRANNRFGTGHKYRAHCELHPGKETVAAKDGKKKTTPPTIHVYSDGEKVGEVKNEREAARLMGEHATKAFAKYVRKELG